MLPHKNPRRSQLLRQLLAELDPDGTVEHHEGPLGAWLRGARLVLAKSGTGSLEACLHGNPTIVVYKLGGLLDALGYHNILSVPHIAGANLIAGRVVVPEHCFAGEGGWQQVGDDAERLWFDDEARRVCRADLDEVRQRLGEAGATGRVAAIVRRFFEGPSSE